MEIIYIAFLVLFIIRQSKNLLFWIYLWQLKNYHIKRFLAHFNTYKGKKVLINPLIKILILVLALMEFNFFPLLFFIYLAEALLALRDVIKKKLILPQKTSKTIFLTSIIFVVFISFVALFAKNDWSLRFILIFDILTIVIVSFIVLIFQPLTVFLRNRIIKKAIKKRKSLDNLSVIGITGSYGKSSVKEYLKDILSEDFNVIATFKNENSEMGISKCILSEVNEKHEIFICEMGAYNKGGIKLLCKIAQPKIGILTGINNQHLATFGSQKNIVESKFELIDSLPAEGLAVVNWENNYIKDNYNSNVATIRCGLDIWAEKINDNSFKVLSEKGKEGVINHKIKGDYNIQNLLMCIAVAKKLGITIKEIEERIAKIEDKTKIKKHKNFDIIDQTYSSNMNGIISHIDFMKKWKGEKIIVMPCLIELGPDAKSSHYEIGRKIGEVCDLAIITTKDFKNDITKGAKFSGMDNIFFIDDPKEIYNKITLSTKSNSVILLESRVPNKLIKNLEK